MSNKQIDEVTGVATTGHEWDGIKELDTPMPRWWVLTFYATIIWAIGYVILYPAVPMISSATKGYLGFSSRGAIKADLAAADQAKVEFVSAIAGKDVKDVLADEKLRTFAIAAGAAAYKVNCVQCHGLGAEGGNGYPNLNDDDWLWGGDITQIKQTITHGIRFAGDEDTHVSDMPAFGEMLDANQIRDVSAYVASLSAMPGFDAEHAKAGQQVFADNCVACHGEDGKGNPELGAPNLTDKISLYVHTPEDIVAQVTKPRLGEMPAWGARLGDTTVKELAVYVHSLGGGK